MEDGAAPHRAKLTQEARERIGIRSLDWPASSPDLNPIEALWQQLKQNICRLPLEQRPTTIEAMQLKICRMWNYLSDMPGTYEGLVESMPERTQAVIAARGGHTRW